MSVIDVKNLTFAYEGSYDNVFENLSFRIDTDWKLGFVGRNGRGKTTLLRLLMGKYPYSGTITASVQFAYFPFEVADKSLDAAQVMRGILGDFEDWRLSRELGLLEIDEDVLGRPFASLSNGEQTKLLLAALFLRENSFLLIDEPTNHLDALGRKTVGRYLNAKSGFILVSHDRAFLDDCVDHIMALNKTGLEIQKGDFSSWQKNRALQDSFEAAENARLKKDVTRLDAAAKRASGWSDKTEKAKYGTDDSGLKPDKGYVGHKSAKMMKRAKNIESRRLDELEKKSGLLKNAEESDALKLAPLSYRAQRLAQLKDVRVFYDGRAVCSDVSFEIERGERINLCGYNGSGKSSILKLICGEKLNFTGEVFLGGGLKISYVPQDCTALCGTLSDYAERFDVNESLFKAMLRKLGFSRTQFDKDMSDFSEGQKKKVLLARSLCESAHLYVWDEPLNFIDVISRIQIEKLLLEYAPTLLFVEHDRAFCENIATKTVTL